MQRKIFQKDHHGEERLNTKQETTTVLIHNLLVGVKPVHMQNQNEISKLKLYN